MHFPAGNQVFYNKVQEFNRDLSICVIEEFGRVLAAERAAARKPTPPRGLRILEALAASGLRSVRYFKEIEGVSHILVNDLKPEAVDTIRVNVLANGLDPAVVVPNCGDAIAVMQDRGREPYDVIDLDPYGSAATFIPAAVANVANGGMIAVTCTDMAVLSGNKPDVAFAKYASTPLHKKHCHEFALRIVLGSLDRAAALHSRYIVPVLSLSIDFYVRLFVRVFNSRAEAQFAATRSALVYQCSGCDDYALQMMGVAHVNGLSKKFHTPIGPPVGQTCVHCGSKFRMGGPIWSKAMHSTPFLTQMLERLATTPDRFKTQKRIAGMVTMATEELPDVPLYWDLPSLFRMCKLTSSRAAVVRSALLSAGYRVSGAHCWSDAVKTDAPARVVFDVIRAWSRLNPPTNLAPESVGARVLALPDTVAVDLTEREDAMPSSRRAGLLRFQENPEAGWGPKARATGKRRAAEAELDSRESEMIKRQALGGAVAGAASAAGAAASAGAAAAADGGELEEAAAMEVDGWAEADEEDA